MYDKKKFGCPEPGCKSEFVSKRGLQNHLKKHRGSYRLNCQVEDCNFGTDDSGKMEWHMWHAHGEEKEEEFAKCKKYQKEFINARSLRNHRCVRVKKFKCSVCKKLYVSEEGLQRHKKRHSKRDRV